jgi:hypothetical protein
MNCRHAAERRLRQFWSVMTSLVESDQLEPEPVTRIESTSAAFGQTIPQAAIHQVSRLPA